MPHVSNEFAGGTAVLVFKAFGSRQTASTQRTCPEAVTVARIYPHTIGSAAGIRFDAATLRV